MILLYGVSKIVKLLEKESGMVVPRGLGKDIKDSMGIEFWSQREEISRDHCKTMYIELTLFIVLNTWKSLRCKFCVMCFLS